MEVKIFRFRLIIGIIGMGSAYAKEFFEVLPQSLKCKALDTTIVYNFTCSSKTINRTIAMRTKDVYFQPGVEINDYHMTVQLFRKLGSTFRPFLIEIDQDMCTFTNAINSGESSFLKRFLNIGSRRKNGNFYDPCPLSGRRYEIDVKNDFSNLPDVVRPGEYRIDTTSYYFKDGVRKDFLLAQAFAEIRSKLSKKTKK